MKPAWRGVVIDGAVWAWPTVLFDHNAAFATLPLLRKYTCRWRQWEPGGSIDFDPGCSDFDQSMVEEWVRRANA